MGGKAKAGIPQAAHICMKRQGFGDNAHCRQKPQPIASRPCWVPVKEHSVAVASPPAGPVRLPVSLIAWGAVGIALNVGAARFTYGVMLPSLRRDLGLDYFAGGTLNAIHLAGYLIGTLAGPSLARRIGMPALAKYAHLLVAAGALGCALVPNTPTAGYYLLALFRLATGLGAGAAIVAILVLTFAAVAAPQRPFVSAVVWSGMGAATVLSGLAVPWLLGTHLGWRVAFAVAALTALALAAFFPPGGTRAAPQIASALSNAFAIRRAMTGRWIFLTLSYLAFGVAYIAYATFVGAQLAAAHAPTGVVMAAWIAFGTATMFGAVWTTLVLGAPALKHFALLAATGAGALGACVATGTSAAAAFGGALLIGLGTAATPAIISAYARDRSTLGEYPRAFSIVTSALGIGQLIGPTLAGALADAFGTTAVPHFAAAAYATAAGLALLDALHNKSAADER
jgi:MFS family permease